MTENRHYNSKAISIREQGICFYCGKVKTGTYHFTLDHVIPISRDGSNSSDNLVCSCSRCNQIKANRTIYETILQLQKDIKFASGSRKKQLEKDLANFELANIKFKERVRYETDK